MLLGRGAARLLHSGFVAYATLGNQYSLFVRPSMCGRVFFGIPPMGYSNLLWDDIPRLVARGNLNPWSCMPLSKDEAAASSGFSLTEIQGRLQPRAHPGTRIERGQSLAKALRNLLERCHPPLRTCR